MALLSKHSLTAWNDVAFFYLGLNGKSTFINWTCSQIAYFRDFPWKLFANSSLFSSDYSFNYFAKYSLQYGTSRSL